MVQSKDDEINFLKNMYEEKIRQLMDLNFDSEATAPCSPTNWLWPSETSAPSTTPSWRRRRAPTTTLVQGQVQRNDDDFSTIGQRVGGRQGRSQEGPRQIRRIAKGDHGSPRSQRRSRGEDRRTRG